LASVGQTVHIEIFVIFAIGSAILTGKVLLKPARRQSLVRYRTLKNCQAQIKSS